MNRTDQPTRWSPAQLPNLWFQKRKPILQFSLWDLCCVMALTGLAVGLTLRVSWEFAFLICSIITAGLVFTLQGRLIRIMLVAVVVCGFVALVGDWFIRAGQATEQGSPPDPVALPPTIAEAAVAGVFIVGFVIIVVTILAAPFVIVRWIIKPFD